ncbi:unnamed protein product [Paramecium primaurelia]|uniref:Uncharacterized protein n=1 Tax=Paramecium primaurelia TaxID=5886 RepID=A0A8S1Q9X3_PARPR|nr:unnamed protein product [Paramecium primaurelia]
MKKSYSIPQLFSIKKKKFLKKNFNNITHSQTNLILSNQQLKMKVQFYWQQESDHYLIETKLEKDKKQMRINSEIIYIDQQNAIKNLKNSEF